MDKYEKIKKLGEGGQGTVTLAKIVAPLDAADREGKDVEKASLSPSSSSAAPVARAAPSAERVDPATSASSASAAPAQPPERPLFCTMRAKRAADEQHARARDHPLGSFVAIKKFRVRDTTKGIDHEVIREIKLLQELDHPNVIRPIDMFKHNFNMNMVLPVMASDLDKLLTANRTGRASISPADVKAYMHAIISAVEHCHSRWILHRDLKPGNVLLGSRGEIRVADFGMSKMYGDEYDMSPQSCTLPYRAPELLLGSRRYGPPMDMWSVGCIFAELCLNRRLFDGAQSDVEQLQFIFSIVGTPTKASWPDCLQLAESGYIEFSPVAPTPFPKLFPALPANAIDLLQRLLALDPARRISARDALAHEYFAETTMPMKTAAEQLPHCRLVR